jgi:hypothetical protein
VDEPAPFYLPDFAAFGRADFESLKGLQEETPYEKNTFCYQRSASPD